MSILGKYTENNSLFNFNQNQLKTGMGYIIVYNIHQKSKLLGTVGLRKWENSYLVSRQGWRSGEASHVCGWEILHYIKKANLPTPGSYNFMTMKRSFVLFFLLGADQSDQTVHQGEQMLHIGSDDHEKWWGEVFLYHTVRTHRLQLSNQCSVDSQGVTRPWKCDALIRRERQTAYRMGQGNLCQVDFRQWIDTWNV